MIEIINDQMNGIQLGKRIDEYGGKREVKKKVHRCILDDHGRIWGLDSYDVEECMINGELVRASHFEEFLEKHQPDLHGGTLYAFFKYNLTILWNSEVRKTMKLSIYHEIDKEFMETECLPSVCEEANKQLEAMKKRNKLTSD